MDWLNFSREPFVWKKLRLETIATGMNCIKLFREFYQNGFGLFPAICTALSVTYTGEPWKERKLAHLLPSTHPSPPMIPCWSTAVRCCCLIES